VLEVKSKAAIRTGPRVIWGIRQAAVSNKNRGGGGTIVPDGGRAQCGSAASIIIWGGGREEIRGNNERTDAAKEEGDNCPMGRTS